VHALKSVKGLTTELEATLKENSDLWSAMQYVANFIWVPEDIGKFWVQFFPVIPKRFNMYVHKAAKAYICSVLAQIRVLWPTIPLKKPIKEIKDEAVLQAVEEAKDTMDNSASDIASQLDPTGGQPVDQPPQ
jgi:hypothetical protein